MKNLLTLTAMIILSSCASAQSLSKKTISNAYSFTWSEGNHSLPAQYAWEKEITVTRDTVYFYSETGGKTSKSQISITEKQYKAFTDAVRKNGYTMNDGKKRLAPGSRTSAFFVEDKDGNVLFGGRDGKVVSENSLGLPFTLFKEPVRMSYHDVSRNMMALIVEIDPQSGKEIHRTPEPRVSPTVEAFVSPGDDFHGFKVVEITGESVLLESVREFYDRSTGSRSTRFIVPRNGTLELSVIDVTDVSIEIHLSAD